MEDRREEEPLEPEEVPPTGQEAVVTDGAGPAAANNEFWCAACTKGFDNRTAFRKHMVKQFVLSFLLLKLGSKIHMSHSVPTHISASNRVAERLSRQSMH